MSCPFLFYSLLSCSASILFYSILIGAFTLLSDPIRFYPSASYLVLFAYGVFGQCVYRMMVADLISSRSDIQTTTRSVPLNSCICLTRLTNIFFPPLFPFSFSLLFLPSLPPFSFSLLFLSTLSPFSFSLLFLPPLSLYSSSLSLYSFSLLFLPSLSLYSSSLLFLSTLPLFSSSLLFLSSLPLFSFPLLHCFDLCFCHSDICLKCSNVMRVDDYTFDTPAPVAGALPLV
jgi:hypothetical protein